MASTSLVAATADMLRVALALMWLWSGSAKLRVLGLFVASAEELARPVPAWLVRPGAHLLPVAEFCLAGLLLVNRWAIVATVLTSLALAVFTAVLIRAWRLRIATSCHCFGGTNDDDRVTGLAVVRTVALVVVAVVATMASVPGRHILYTSPVGTLGVLVGAGLLVAGSALAGTSVWLVRQVEPGISEEVGKA